MKFKELFFGIGLKPGPREYGFDVRHFDFPIDGRVEFAQWRHPSARRRPTILTQDSVTAARHWLEPGDFAIDVGAHSGDSTIPLALAVGPTGLVLALEPNPYVFKLLLANSALNRRATNIHPCMFAATEKDGTFTFEYSDPGFCNGGMHVNVGRWKHAHFFDLEVQGRHVPSYVEKHYAEWLPKLRFIKLDTEGLDRIVYHSLRDLTKRWRPVLQTEIYKHMPLDERRGYVADLKADGYEVRRVTSDREPEGVPVTDEDLERLSHFDALAVPASR